MASLHRAALRRAYRTLAQGLGGSATATALTALVMALTSADGASWRPAALVAASTVGSALVAAWSAYWVGIKRGLPEVADA